MSFEELLQGLKAGPIRVTIKPAPSSRPRNFSIGDRSAVDHAKGLAFIADWDRARSASAGSKRISSWPWARSTTPV